MSKGFIVYTTGKPRAFAYITVEYPAKNTCTCYNAAENKTLTAETTSGLWVFAVPYAGTWTVQTTGSSGSASQNVSITTNGQSVTVDLVGVAVFLYDNGNQYTATSGGWTVTGDTRLEATAILVQGTGFTNRASTKNYLTLSKYKTMYVTVSDISVGNEGNPALEVLAVASDGSALGSVKVTEAGTVALPVSGITKPASVWLRASGESYMWARISQIRLR